MPFNVTCGMVQNLWCDPCPCDQWGSCRSTTSHVSKVLLPQHDCWAASFASNSSEVMEDEAPLMQTNAPETQGVILGQEKIKIYNYKNDHVAERPQNTTNTILLEVISENFQICDLSFCLRGLVESHAHTSELFEVFPLIAFLPENNSSTKTIVTLGGNSMLRECC